MLTPLVTTHIFTKKEEEATSFLTTKKAVHINAPVCMLHMLYVEHAILADHNKEGSSEFQTYG